MLHRLNLVPAVLVLALTGCAGAKAPQSGPQAPLSSETRVQVTNHNWADMRVYLERDGMRVRLGTVTSMAKQVFQIPRTMVGSTGNLRLIADPIGGREMHTTPVLQVWPGQLVDFTIENHLAISSVAVW